MAGSSGREKSSRPTRRNVLGQRQPLRDLEQIESVRSSPCLIGRRICATVTEFDYRLSGFNGPVIDVTRWTTRAAKDAQIADLKAALRERDRTISVLHGELDKLHAAGG